MSRRILVFTHSKEFRITIPDDAKVTFASWSPPSKDGYARTPDQLAGTLRVYKTEKNILACFSGVVGFRDVSMEYEEKVAVEEGSSIWKSDEKGYTRENKVQVQNEWKELE